MQNRPRPALTAMILWGCLLLICQTAATPSSASNDNLPGDLQALIGESLKANSEVKQMRSLFRASKEAVKSAGALDDPEAAFTIKDLPTDTWSFSQEDMTQKMFEISQKLPFPGKRRLRTEVAESQAQADAHSILEKINEIRAKVIIDYWNLALAYTSFDITQKNKLFWEQVVQVAETRYSVGQGNQADVLQAQVELGNYLDRLFQWTQKQESAKGDLNALRSKPAQTPLPKPLMLAPRPFNMKFEELLTKAEARPQLHALKALIAKQGKAVDLAKKDYFPDLTIGVNYGIRENREDLKRSDMFGTKFMINLPIWQGSKIKPKIREEMAKEEAAKDAHQASWNQLVAAVKDRYVKLQRLSRQIALLDQGIIPQARQAASATLASYQVGSLDFAQLYQSQISVYNAELQLQEYLKDFEENWAELEWLVGQELPRTPGGKR